MPLSGELSIGGMSRGKVKEEPWLIELSAVCLLPDLLPAQKDRPHCGHLPPQRFPVDWVVFPVSLWKYTYSSTAPSVLDHNDHPIRCINQHFLENTIFGIYFKLIYMGQISHPSILENKEMQQNPPGHMPTYFHINFHCKPKCCSSKLGNAIGTFSFRG